MTVNILLQIVVYMVLAFGFTFVFEKQLIPVLKNKKVTSYTFMTEVPDINKSNYIKNKKNIIKTFQNKIIKFNSNSNLTLSRKNIKEKNKNKGNLKTRLKNFSANDLFTSKALISRYQKTETKSRES